MTQKLEIIGKYIRIKKSANDLFLNIFKGRKIMKIYDVNIAREFIEWYNNKNN